MVDNLAEKVEQVSAKSGSLSIASLQLRPQKLFVIWSSGVSTIQGLLMYSRDFQNCPLYHGVFDFQGCPLSGVPLY